MRNTLGPYLITLHTSKDEEDNYMCDLHVYLHVFNSPWAILWIYVKYTCTLHIKLLLPGSVFRIINYFV